MGIQIKTSEFLKMEFYGDISEILTSSLVCVTRNKKINFKSLRLQRLFTYSTVFANHFFKLKHKETL